MYRCGVIFTGLALIACWHDGAQKEIAEPRAEPEAGAAKQKRADDEGRTLKVTGIEPDRGDALGDTYVIINGNRFVADGPRRAEVYFGTQQAGFRKGVVVRFASDQQLIVRAPGGKPGEVVDVLLVFEPGGQLRIPGAFTFVDKSSPPP